MASDPVANCSWWGVEPTVVLDEFGREWCEMEFPQGLEGSGYEQLAETAPSADLGGDSPSLLIVHLAEAAPSADIGDSGTELEDGEDEESLAKRRRLWVDARTYTLEQYHEMFPQWARVNRALRHRYYGRTNLRNTRKFIKKFRPLEKCPYLRDFGIFYKVINQFCKRSPWQIEAALDYLQLQAAGFPEGLLWD